MNSFLYNNYRHLYYLLITNPILLIEKSWVAVSSFIGMDVTIGKGAASVVTRDVGKYEIVGGNPAKFIKKRIIND